MKTYIGELSKGDRFRYPGIRSRRTTYTVVEVRGDGVKAKPDAGGDTEFHKKEWWNIMTGTQPHMCIKIN